MGFWAAAAPYIATAVGAGLGALQGSSNNKPQKSYNQPANWLGGKQNVQEAQGWLRDAYDPANATYQGPQQSDWWKNYGTGGRGGGGQGGGPPMLQGGGGGGGGPKNYGAMLPGGGGGGGGRNATARMKATFANFQPKYTDYQEETIGTGRDNFMDIAGNQYLQDAKAATGQQLGEQFDRMRGESLAPFANNNTLGMSGAGMLSRQNMMDDWTQNMANTYANMDYQQYNQNLAHQGNIAGQFEGTRQAGIGALASVEGSRLAAGANKYGSKLAAIASMYGSDASAGASRYGSRLGHNASVYGSHQAAGAQRMGHNLNYKLGSENLRYNMERGYGQDQMQYDMYRQNAASNYWGDTNAGNRQYGNTYNQGPQQSVAGSAALGGWNAFNAIGGPNAFRNEPGQQGDPDVGTQGWQGYV